MGLSTKTAASAAPGIQLPDIDDEIKFAVIDADPNVPVLNYKTGEPEKTMKGAPKLQIRLTVLVLEAKGAVTGPKGSKTAIEAGFVGSIYVSSYSKWDPDNDKAAGANDYVSFSEAVDRAVANLSDVDDIDIGWIGMWKYVRDLPSQGEDPRKDRKFRLRPPSDAEFEIVARCQSLHDELNGDAAAAEHVADGGDEEPF